MQRDKVVIHHVTLLYIHHQQCFHDALQRTGVTAKLNLEVARSNVSRAIGRHFDDVLRIGKALENALAQQVEYNDRHLAPRQFVQSTHHAWVVSSWVLPNRNDELRMVEIFQRNGAFADANLLRQPLHW